MYTADQEAWFGWDLSDYRDDDEVGRCKRCERGEHGIITHGKCLCCSAIIEEGA